MWRGRPIGTPLDERRAYEAVVQAEQSQQQDMAEIDAGIRRAEQVRVRRLREETYREGSVMYNAQHNTVARAAVTTTGTTVTASGGLVATASAFAVANPLVAAILVGSGTAVLVGGTIYGTYRLWCWLSKK